MVTSAPPVTFALAAISTPTAAVVDIPSTVTATPKPTSTQIAGPTLAVPSPVNQAPIFAAQADAAVNNRNWAEALAAISRAIELVSDNPQYYIRRAFIYDAGLGQMDKAIAEPILAAIANHRPDFEDDFSGRRRVGNWYL